VVDFLDERPLDERVDGLGVPALIVFGNRDRRTDPTDSRASSCVAALWLAAD
jgi:hypothetical protein